MKTIYKLRVCRSMGFGDTHWETIGHFECKKHCVRVRRKYRKRKRVVDTKIDVIKVYSKSDSYEQPKRGFDFLFPFV